MHKNHNQKILIISDTHLTKRFDKKKYDFLKKLIANSDKVIINGDFWDSWFTTFDDFVHSKWQDLFPALLEKETVYIFGNHDLKKETDDRIKLFSVKGVESYDLEYDDEIYHIEHGRRILELEKDRFLLTYGQIMQILENHNFKVMFWILNLLEIISYKIFEEKMMYTKFAHKRNFILKRAEKHSWLVCGDTHCPEIDNARQFANSGCILHGYATYLTIDIGKVSLHAETY